MGSQAVIFASPPWGGQFHIKQAFAYYLHLWLGPSYTEFEVFDLSVMQPYNMKFLYESFSKITKEIAIYLPRNSDLDQIASLAPKDKLPVVHYCMRGASKVRNRNHEADVFTDYISQALVVYYGGFSDPME